jgi:alpha-glucosidase
MNKRTIASRIWKNMQYDIVILSICFLICFANLGFSADEHEILSPDQNITVKIDIRENISYSVFFKSKQILEPSPVSMTLRNHGILGDHPVLEDASQKSESQKIHPVVRVKNETIIDHFNQLTLKFQDNYSLIFRVYDDGLAYRFQTFFDQDIDILSEEVVFHFHGDPHVYLPLEKSFFTHQERTYSYLPLSQVSDYEMCYPPALVDIKEGLKVAITEADLEDYPGLYLQGSGGPFLKGIFPAVALKERQTSDRDVRIVQRANYIARTSGQRSFPWRVLVIADEDKDLLQSQMVFKLAKPLQLEDTSWIKPGKVAWDWWNANNIYGVDFRAGVNTETYKSYIDFASEFGIEYVILDEGWYILGDLLNINPDIDIQEITDYAESKNVGIILWVVWKTLHDQLQKALDQFEKWGVKGIKVDFMQRDDQWMVNYYHQIAQEAAERHLIVDFHGAYKPTGLRRAYPNVLTREGVLGLEHNKWSKNVTPEHDLTIPFTRMLAGPMDYTPGAMINAQKSNFRAIFSRPMSMGTRCHQLAMYVVYESPLQMLADSPTHYLREKECLEFLSQVPCVWDETLVLEACVADYIVIARRAGSSWYLGAMTDETAREFSICLDFLDNGDYEAEIFRDGINADRNGNDYKKNTMQVIHKDTLKIKMAPGGGWVARIRIRQTE